MSVTNGELPGDVRGRKSASGYSPNVGVTAFQAGTPSSDGQNQPSAPLVVAGKNGNAFVSIKNC